MSQRKYRLCSCPGRYITGHLPDGRQVLMGVCCPKFELFYFNSNGDFSHVETRKLSIPPSIRNGVYYFDPIAQASLEADVADWSTALQLTESAIDIHVFAANDAYIEDLPSELMELEGNPENFDDEERQELLEWKKEWCESDLYAFWWGDELWIDRDGSVNTS